MGRPGLAWSQSINATASSPSQTTFQGPESPWRSDVPSPAAADRTGRPLDVVGRLVAPYDVVIPPQEGGDRAEPVVGEHLVPTIAASGPLDERQDLHARVLNADEAGCSLEPGLLQIHQEPV